MLEKYYKYKLDYRDYLILIKCGSFYECIDTDAFIINKITNYKLKRLSNTFKAGFPINTLDKVIDKLFDENINYIIVDNEITEIKEFDNNTYSNYNFNDKDIFYNSIRIERIIKSLNDNLTNKDFTNVLNKIENIIKDKL